LCLFEGYKNGSGRNDNQALKQKLFFNPN